MCKSVFFLAIDIDRESMLYKYLLFTDFTLSLPTCCAKLCKPWLGVKIYIHIILYIIHMVTLFQERGRNLVFLWEYLHVKGYIFIVLDYYKYILNINQTGKYKHILTIFDLYLFSYLWRWSAVLLFIPLARLPEISNACGHCHWRSVGKFSSFSSCFHWNDTQ